MRFRKKPVVIDGAAWRGDHFESDLRKALERYDAAWDAVIFAK